MFIEVFKYLPVATVLGERVLVIHGGLFHRDAVALAQLEALDRTDYSAKPTAARCAAARRARRARARLAARREGAAARLPLVGPAPEARPRAEQRGAGVKFGPDVVAEFLAHNAPLSMVVRSHECVARGFDLPYDLQKLHARDAMDLAMDPARRLAPEMLRCATIFSASNYGGSGRNLGAYLTFRREGSKSLSIGGAGEARSSSRCRRRRARARRPRRGRGAGARQRRRRRRPPVRRALVLDDRRGRRARGRQHDEPQAT